MTEFVRPSTEKWPIQTEIKEVGKYLATHGVFVGIRTPDMVEKGMQYGYETIIYCLRYTMKTKAKIYV